MPYIYQGPIPPQPTASTPANDPAWTNWWNYQQSLFRQYDIAAREKHNEIMKEAADAQAKLAADMLKPTDRVKPTLAERITDLATEIKTNSPTMNDVTVIQAAEQFFRRIGFAYPL
jgi:hypothetical protein